MITKHPTTFRIKSGVDKDGRVVARACEVFWNGGAYADIGPRVTQKSGFTAPGPYDIDNVSIDSYELYTNRTPAGALRGFGIPQLVWAYESHTDLIARELGIDPVEFRRKNILRDGRPQASGTAMKDAAIAEVLEAIAARMGWSAPFDRGTGTIRRGRGIAIGFKASISPTTSVAIVNVSADGSDHALHQHRRHGAGLGHRVRADRRRGARRRGRRRPRRSPRHRRDALRHGHARLALAVPHGQCGAACRRGRARQAARARRRGRAARRHQLSAGGNFQEALRHAGRQRDRLGELRADLQIARRADRAVRQRHAVLDGRRRRRRGRGRHRDRRVRVSTGSSTPPIAAGRSIPAWRARSSPAPRSCSSASRCPKSCSSTAAR